MAGSVPGEMELPAQRGGCPHDAAAKQRGKFDLQAVVGAARRGGVLSHLLVAAVAHAVALGVLALQVGAPQPEARHVHAHGHQHRRLLVAVLARANVALIVDKKSSEEGQWMRRQEYCAHIRQTHLIKGHLIKDLLRCGGFPGREVGVILVVALAERSGAG